jgi:hypothetical protein
MFFDVDEIDVAGLDELVEVLRFLETQRHSCLMTGALRDPSKRHGVQRTKYPSRPNGNFVAGSHRLQMVDVDEIPVPRHIKSYDEAAEWYIREFLPSEFHETRYVRQWSSSAGFDRTLSAHFWFELDRFIGDKKMHDWALRWNVTKGAKVVDPQVFTSNQPLYTASPIFDGVDDPFRGCRTTLVEKPYPTVNILLPATAPTSPARSEALGSGWQRYIPLLADVSRSYYASARDMIASYVRCTAGRGDEGLIIDLAMAAAKRRAGAPATTEAKLRGLYRSAQAKYGACRASLPAAATTEVVGVTLPDSVKEEGRSKETNTYDLRSWKRGGGDDLNNGLPDDLTYMRSEYFDNGRRRGKARHTAKLAFTNKPSAEIDTRALTARYVDFTDPVRFKRTMANHCPDDAEWYEAHRQFAYELRDRDNTIREVLIGHVQRRWYDRSTGLRSHLYRYRRQIAYLLVFKSGRKQIVVKHGDKEIRPQKRFQRRLSLFLPPPGPRASEIVFYHDPHNAYRAHLSEKTARRRMQDVRERIIDLRARAEERAVAEEIAAAEAAYFAKRRAA